MIEYTVICIVVAISGILLARRFYRQLRVLIDGSEPLSCSQGCCGCSISSHCQQSGDKNQACSAGQRQ